MHYNLSTTQNVDIEFQIASLGDRLLAYVLDNLVKFFYVVVVGILLNLMDQFTNPSSWLLMLLIPVIFYTLLCEIFLNGQTFGKIIMKIRVVKQDGDELTVGSSFIRWIFRLVDFQMSSGVAAILTIAIGGKGQRVGDIVAGTSVLKIDGGSRLEETIFEQIPENYNPSFPEVDRLTDEDVQTVKEVLSLTSKDNEYANGAPHPLIMKTKDVVEQKLQITSKLPSKTFLETVLKDFNYYHQ